MMQWTPQKSNQTAKYMILLLFCGAVALLAVSSIWRDLSFRWIFQATAITLLTGAIFLVTRYLTKMFIYRVVETEEGTPDLTVTECAANGKRAVTVCRIGLSQILSVRRFDFSDGGTSDSAWKEFRKGRKKIHDYRVDLKPVNSILLTVSEGEEKLYLLLSYEPDLFDLLKQYEQGEVEE